MCDLNLTERQNRAHPNKTGELLRQTLRQETERGKRELLALAH